MKRMYLIGLIFSIAVVFTGSHGYAYPVNVGDLIILSDSWGSTNGGEFTVTVIGSDYSFQTFCVETGEYLAFGKQFKVVGISTAAVWGGVDPGGDLLDPETAYLFSNFAAGTLADYEYTPGDGRVASADLLQRAIWYLEGESGGVDNEYVELANGSGWTDIGNVRVLNLEWAVDYGSYKIGDRAQDILVTVPEPGILILLGIAMSAVGLAARRYRF